MSEALFAGPALLAPSSGEFEAANALARIGQYIGRRTVGRLAAANRSFMLTHWQETLTGIEPVDEVTPDTIPLEAWVAIPGLGTTDAISKARLLRQYLPSEDRIVAGINIATRGTTAAELGSHYGSFMAANKAKYASALCQSMGLMRFLSMVLQVDQPVGRVIADCAAGSFSALHHGNAFKYTVPLLERFSYEGGRAGKSAVVLLNEIGKNGLLHMGTNIRATQRETETGACPTQHVGDLKELRQYFQFNFFENWRLFIGKINSDSHISFCRPKDATTDRVVRIDRACEQTSDFCGKLGAKFDVIMVPEGGHAQTHLSLTAAEGWINNTNSALAA